MQKTTEKLIDIETVVREHKICLEALNMILEQSEVNLEAVPVLLKTMRDLIDRVDDALKEVINDSRLP